MKTLNELIERAKSAKTRRLAVAEGADAGVLSAVHQAAEQDLVNPVLFGNVARMNEIAAEMGLNLASMELVDCPTPELAAREAVSCVHRKEADIVMKGLVGTDVYLRAILNKEWGLRTRSILSHVALFEVPAYHKLLLVTDAAMNIAPDVEQKVHITKNAVSFMAPLQEDPVKVAFIAHNEKVSPGVPASEDAAMLAMMARRGQLGNIIADGPLALDNAISHEAAEHKGIDSPVAGDADVVICPDIQSGNALYKSLTYFASARCAALIAGAAAPVVLTSRADTPENKLMSIVFAALTAR